MERVSRASAAFAILLISGACGGGGKGGSSTPSSPTPTVTTFNLAGRIVETGTTSAIGGAAVSIGDGPNAGRSTTSDAGGNYSLSGLQQSGFTVTASKDGYVPQSQGITLTSNQTLNFSLQRSGPRTTFGQGQYLVNSDIAAGRYFSDPASGCYWERESGLGGTLGEIIANDFVAFDAAQWIVDILPSDRAFKTESSCGTWSMSPRGGLQSSISPGSWLVGSQLSPGTYRVNAAPGCYWERLRDFQGTLNSIIANDFVANGGQQLVEIRSSDVGFDGDADCGTWTKISNVVSPASADGLQSLAERERFWMLNRQKKGLK